MPPSPSRRTRPRQRPTVVPGPSAVSAAALSPAARVSGTLVATRSAARFSRKLPACAQPQAGPRPAAAGPGRCHKPGPGRSRRCRRSLKGAQEDCLFVQGGILSARPTDRCRCIQPSAGPVQRRIASFAGGQSGDEGSTHYHLSATRLPGRLPPRCGFPVSRAAVSRAAARPMASPDLWFTRSGVPVWYCRSRTGRGEGVAIGEGAVRVDGEPDDVCAVDGQRVLSRQQIDAEGRRGVVVHAVHGDAARASRRWHPA